MMKGKKTPRPAPTPKLPKPWDVPPPPKAGDKDETTLYAAIGRALTAWSELEERFASIFACLVVAGEPEPAARAYGSVLTFRGQKEMIAAAAEAFFFLYPNEGRNEGSQLQAALGELLTEAGNFAPRRNEIAHGLVLENKPLAFDGRASGLFGSMRPPMRDPKRPIGFVLIPADHATNKTEMEKGQTLLFPVNYVPRYVYSSAEIAAFTAEFQRLEQWARQFPLIILGHRERAKERTFP